MPTNKNKEITSTKWIDRKKKLRKKGLQIHTCFNLLTWRWRPVISSSKSKGSIRNWISSEAPTGRGLSPSLQYPTHAINSIDIMNWIRRKTERERERPWSVRGSAAVGRTQSVGISGHWRENLIVLKSQVLWVFVSFNIQRGIHKLCWRRWMRIIINDEEVLAYKKIRGRRKERGSWIHGNWVYRFLSKLIPIYLFSL